MANTNDSEAPADLNEAPAADTSGKTPEQIRADAIAAGIELTKKNNPGWSGEGPWPPVE